MTLKVFVSGLSGNKEVKKRQQRVLMILDSKSIDYSVIDITEPGKENEKEFMQQNSKPTNSDSTVKTNPLPPQIFNEDDYCGNYEEFDLANEMDDLEKFLKLPFGSLGTTSPGNGISNGAPTSRETSADKDFVPNEESESIILRDEDDYKENEISNEIPETVDMEEKDISEMPDDSTVEETDIVNEEKEIEESALQPEE